MRILITVTGIVSFIILIMIISFSLNKDEVVYVINIFSVSIAILSLIVSMLTLYFAITIYDRFGLKSLIKQKEYLAAYEIKRYFETYQLYNLSLNTIKGSFPTPYAENSNSIIKFSIDENKSIFIRSKDLDRIYFDIKNKILNTENFSNELNRKLNLSFLIYIYSENPYYKSGETPTENDYIFSTENKSCDKDIEYYKYINSKSFIDNWKDLIREIDKYLPEEFSSLKLS